MGRSLGEHGPGDESGHEPVTALHPLVHNATQEGVKTAMICVVQLIGAPELLWKTKSALIGIV